MSAAENKRVGIEPFSGGFGGQLVQVDVDDFGGDGVVGPAFFDQWNEQRAGLLERARSPWAWQAAE